MYRTYRFGRSDLKYIIPVENGEYEVDLHFVEPWYLAGGGFDCTKWRLFDVAVNGERKLENVDIWKKVGHDRALVITVDSKSKDGKLVISFPHCESYQAIISALAVRKLK